MTIVRTAGVIVALAASAALVAYGLIVWNPQRKIDAFCNSIDTTTPISQIKSIAERTGVTLTAGPVQFSEGIVYATAAIESAYGKYACSVQGKSMDGKVERKVSGWQPR